MSKGANPYLILDNLFNSKVRTKVLKFLFRNYPVNFGVKELARRVQELPEVVKKEVKVLKKIGLVRKI